MDSDSRNLDLQSKSKRKKSFANDSGIPLFDLKFKYVLSIQQLLINLSLPILQPSNSDFLQV